MLPLAEPPTAAKPSSIKLPSASHTHENVPRASKSLASRVISKVDFDLKGSYLSGLRPQRVCVISEAALARLVNGRSVRTMRRCHSRCA